MFAIRFEQMDAGDVLLPIDGTAFENNEDGVVPFVVAYRGNEKFCIKGTLDDVIKTINAEMRNVQVQAMQQARLAGLGPINLKG